jgi:hypothetical protein
VSVCTQFPGLYASYELMTLVALATTLFRARRALVLEREWENKEPRSGERNA